MQNNKIHIDCFLSIVDNFWDMGFACELIRFFSKSFPDAYFFHVFSNQVDMLVSMFDKNWLSQNIEIIDAKNYLQKAKIAFSFFHCPIPAQKYPFALRFDYLSLDDFWLTNNLSEHILSTSEYKIIEMIPSPKNTWSGLLPRIANVYHRQNFVDKFGIGNPEKKWFSCFCYQDTFEKLHFDISTDDVEIFLFGKYQWIKNVPKNIHIMPFLAIEDFYGFLSVSDYIITRGEISFMQVLQMWKPFLWDLYHDIGGFPHDQSEDFLDFLQANENYQKLSHTIWHSKNPVSLQEIIAILEENRRIFQAKEYKNFGKEVKKMLDKMQKSI